MSDTNNTHDQILNYANQSSIEEITSKKITDSQEITELDINAIVDLLLKAQHHEKFLLDLGRLSNSAIAEMHYRLGTIITTLNQVNKSSVKKINKQYLNIAIKESAALKEIIDQLFGWSRCSQINQTKIEINQLCRNILGEISILPQVQNRRLKLSYAESPLYVLGDRFQLKQAIYNIIFNCCDNTQARSIITWRINPDLKHHRVKISFFTNSKIQPQLLSQNAKSAIAINFTDLDLRLTIAKQIIESHCSNLAINSSLDSGTTICFYLKMLTNSETLCLTDS